MYRPDLPVDNILVSIINTFNFTLAVFTKCPSKLKQI